MYLMQLTPLQRIEQAALLGDRLAVTRLISALRGYRAIIRQAFCSANTPGAEDCLEAECTKIEEETVACVRCSDKKGALKIQEDYGNVSP
jgi:hypothetical protein